MPRAIRKDRPASRLFGRTFRGWVGQRDAIFGSTIAGASETLIGRAYATELVALAPDVIVANGTLASTALQRATRSIPVVFVVVIDPVGAGLVQSLAHPGGNITGFATFEPEIGGKWLELLTEISPGLRRVAGILDPAFLGFATVWREIESIAPRFGLGVTKGGPSRSRR